MNETAKTCRRKRAKVFNLNMNMISTHGLIAIQEIVENELKYEHPLGEKLVLITQSTWLKCLINERREQL